MKLVELKNLRLQHGWSQEFTAQKVGISLSYYSKIECGFKTPSIKVAKKLAETFNTGSIDLILKVG